MSPQIERENSNAYKVQTNIARGDGDGYDNDNGESKFLLTNEQHSPLRSLHGSLETEQKGKFNFVNGGNIKEKPNKNRENAFTLAEKLKQSLTQTQQQPNKIISPPLSTRQQSIPRLVVKEVQTTKLPKDKTRSIMVRGLYRGLRHDDITKYFAQFGTVMNFTSPPCVSGLDDGAKYAFLKFADYESVEKAVGKEIKPCTLMWLIIFLFHSSASSRCEGNQNRH